jgi:hypothetical protein
VSAAAATIPYSTPQGQAPEFPSPGDSTGGVADASTGFSPTVTGYDPSLVGMGLQAATALSPMGLPGTIGRAFLSQALNSSLGRSVAPSNLSDATGPVAYTGSNSLLGSLMSALGFGFGGNGPSFVGSVNAPAGVNANLGTEFAGLAPMAMPVGLAGLNFLGASPNMGLYSGLGLAPSTFSGLAGQPGARTAGVAPTGEISEGQNQFGGRVSGGDDPEGGTVSSNPSEASGSSAAGLGEAGVGSSSGPAAGAGSGEAGIGEAGVGSSSGAAAGASSGEAGIGEAGVGSGGPGDGGGGGGGDGGSTVICTELRRQGRMDDATWRADEAFGRSVSRVTLAGYYVWGRPLARLMARSLLTTTLVAPLALCWAREMAYRMGARPHGSVIGRVIMAVGIPLCTFLGRLIAHPTPLHRS